MNTQSKVIIGLSIAALSGWGMYLFNPPPPEVKTLVQDRVVHVDRVVTQEVVKTIIRPDGTRIVTETKVKDTSKESTKDSVKLSSVPALARYSLGLSVAPDFSELTPYAVRYEVEGAKRIGQSALWVTASVSSRGDLKEPAIGLGLRWEF